jgi:hypothetical protein
VIAEQIDIRAEAAKVHGELLFFRRRVLPALFETRLDAVFGEEYCDWVRERWSTVGMARGNSPFG